MWMQARIEEIKKYAKENKVPIILDDGLDLLKQIVLIKQPKRILEIGTAIGYSAINMIYNNKVIIDTIEKDVNMYNIALKNINRLDLNKQIYIYNLDALLFDALEKYDLIFIDAAKSKYLDYFKKFSLNLNSNGIIICDNMNFHGLIDKSNIESKNLKGLLKKLNNFRSYLEENNEFNTVIYKIGDGISVSIKKD